MKNWLKLFQDNAGIVKQPINLARNEAGTEVTIYIYGVISADWGISAMDVISALHEARDATTLNIRINSPGGSIFEERAIISAIKGFSGKTVAYIDGICASAATGVAIACNEVVMSQGAFFMIHNAAWFAAGDKAEMRRVADVLEKIELSIVADYVAKTGKDEQVIIDWMNVETWFDADEALENGFVDRLAEEESEKPANVWNLAAFKNAPDAFKQMPAPSKPPAAPDNHVDQDASAALIQNNRNKLALLQIS